MRPAASRSSSSSSDRWAGVMGHPAAPSGCSSGRCSTPIRCSAASTGRASVLRSRAGYSIVQACGDSSSFNQRHTEKADAFHLQHLQEALVGKNLPRHPLVSTVVVSESCKDGILRTLRPFSSTSTSLATWTEGTWDTHSSNLPLLRNHVTSAAADVAASGILALQHLQDQGIIHGNLTMKSFLVSRDDSTGLLVCQLANFGHSRLHNAALSPAAHNLGVIPPEFCTVEAMKHPLFIQRASLFNYDIFGLGTTLLQMFVPGSITRLSATSHGINGPFTAPSQYVGLMKAAKSVAEDPAGTYNAFAAQHPWASAGMDETCADFISQCLKPAPARWTPAQAAAHPFVRERLAALSQILPRLAATQQQERTVIIQAAPAAFAVPLEKPASSNSAAAVPASDDDEDLLAEPSWCDVDFCRSGRIARSVSMRPQRVPSVEPGVWRYLCRTGFYTYNEDVVHTTHAYFNAYKQELAAARRLPLHPAIQGVAAASPTLGEFLHLRRPTPFGMDLWEYCDLLRRRYSKNPAALGCAMRQTAKAVMSCGVLALQHLQAHGVVHGSMTPFSFVLVDETVQGPVFQLRDFSRSRVGGTTLCPGAENLANVPRELTFWEALTQPSKFLPHAHPTGFDIWSLGITLLQLFCPEALTPLSAEAYGLEGDWAAPHNWAGLALALEVMSSTDLLGWVEGYYPGMMAAMGDNCVHLLKRCLDANPCTRCTPDEACKSAFLATSLDKSGYLSKHYASISRVQTWLHAAMDQEQDEMMARTRQPKMPHLPSHLMHLPGHHPPCATSSQGASGAAAATPPPPLGQVEATASACKPESPVGSKWSPAATSPSLEGPDAALANDSAWDFDYVEEDSEGDSDDEFPCNSPVANPALPRLNLTTSLASAAVPSPAPALGQLGGAAASSQPDTPVATSSSVDLPGSPAGSVDNINYDDLDIYDEEEQDSGYQTPRPVVMPALLGLPQGGVLGGYSSSVKRSEPSAGPAAATPVTPPAASSTGVTSNVTSTCKPAQVPVNKASSTLMPVSTSSPPPAVARRFSYELFPTPRRPEWVPPLDLSTVKKKGTARRRLVFTSEPVVAVLPPQQLEAPAGDAGEEERGALVLSPLLLVVLVLSAPLLLLVLVLLVVIIDVTAGDSVSDAGDAGEVGHAGESAGGNAGDAGGMEDAGGTSTSSGSSSCVAASSTSSHLSDSAGDAGGEVEPVGGSSTSSGAGASSVSQSPVAKVPFSSQDVVTAASECAAAPEEVCGSTGSSGSSAVCAARGSVALRIAFDMCVGGSIGEGLSSASVLAAACAVQQWLGRRCLMAAAGAAGCKSSSSEGQVSCGTCGRSLMGVDAVHSSMASACYSAGDLWCMGQLVTGAMPRTMLLGDFTPTLVCPQGDTVIHNVTPCSSSTATLRGKARKPGQR